MKEAVVRKMQMRLSLILLSVVLVLAGCGRTNQAAAPADTTQTVAPAASQPAPNDPVTDTVNVDDGRSEEEGSAGGETSTHAATTTHAPAKASKPAKKQK